MKTSALNMTNEERLRRYPNGKCPLCGGQNWQTHRVPEDDESYVQCEECSEAYRIESEGGDDDETF